MELDYFAENEQELLQGVEQMYYPTFCQIVNRQD